jgi:Tol biopolymer transport system component
MTIGARQISPLVLFVAALAPSACGSGVDGFAAAPSGVEAGPVVEGVTMRRLWTGDPTSFYAASPSPDGRWLAEPDWSSGDLAVRDLSTDELHRLTAKGSWEAGPELTEISMFSPDGRHLVYGWYSAELNHYELRILDFRVDDDGVPRGSNIRTFFSSPELSPYWLWGWSPDGEILTTIYRPDRTNALALVGIDDGTMRVLKSFDWREPRAVLSPDGRMLAYDFPTDEGSPDRDIHLLSTDGTRESTVLEGPGMDRVLAWLPGDGGLLVHSQRSGSPSVWRIPMSDDGPSGSPQLVRSDVLRPEPLGLTHAGFYLAVETDAPRFRSAAFDAATGRLSGTPVVWQDPYGGEIGTWTWSPDGRFVLHNSTRRSRDETLLVLRSADGDPIRNFRFDIRLTGSVRWSPDGESVFMTGIDDRGRRAIRRIRLESGEIEMIRDVGRPPFSMGGQIAVAPDSRSIVLRVRAPDATEKPPGQYRGQLVSLDLESGVETPIGPTSFLGPQEFSPDGRWLAFVDTDSAETTRRLVVMPATGGEQRELFRATDIEAPSWTPDSRTLVFQIASHTEAVTAELSGERSVWKVDVASGAAMRLPDFDSIAPYGVRLHPHGRQIVFLSGERRGEIWAMQGLPGLDARITDLVDAAK